MKQLTKQKVFKELDKIAKRSNEDYSREHFFNELEINICFRDYETDFINECLNEYID